MDTVTLITKKLAQTTNGTYYIAVAALSVAFIVTHPFGLFGFVSRTATLLAIVLALKVYTRKERPDKTDKLAFPSGHAAFAFFLAAMFNFNPLMLLWAAGVGASRIVAKKHDIKDVVAGAALGMLFGYGG